MVDLEYEKNNDADVQTRFVYLGGVFFFLLLLFHLSAPWPKSPSLLALSDWVCDCAVIREEGVKTAMEYCDRALVHGCLQV